MKIFSNNNYSKYNYYNYISNLNLSKEELWKNIYKKARGDINQEKRRNIVIKKLEENNLKEFMKLNQEWAKTKGLKISNIEKEKRLLWKIIRIISFKFKCIFLF